MQHDAVAFRIGAPFRTAIKAAETALFCRFVWRLTFVLWLEGIWGSQGNGMEGKAETEDKL